MRSKALGEKQNFLTEIETVIATKDVLVCDRRGDIVHASSFFTRERFHQGITAGALVYRHRAGS